MKTTERLDVVLMRKSTSAQLDSEQRQNIERGLKEKEIYVPQDCWYSDTRSRFKPEQGAHFQTLLKLVEQGRIKRIFVESQDRFGAGRGGKKLFGTLDKLRQHKTQLIDLRTGNDLTSEDMATELTAYIQAKKDEMELLDTTYRSLRSKLGKMTSKGGWPGGPPPLGYDKAYYGEDGRLLWVFHHTEMSLGDQYFPGEGDKLIPGPKGIRPPRSDKHNTPKLIPDPIRTEMIRDIFRWWTTEKISRRQIAHRLNQRGDKLYTGHWTHTNVTTTLRNPAYIGIVAYGRSSRAEIQQFDKDSKITPVTEPVSKKKMRKLEDCPHKENAHPAIIDRAVWDAAQKKLTRDTRKEYEPRNPEYYLKGLLFCGHCGKPLTPSSDRKKPEEGGKIYRKYICPTYNRGLLTGMSQKCGAFRITTLEADRIINEKLKEIGASPAGTTNSRAKLETETHLLGTQADELREKLHQIVTEGMTSYLDELRTVYGMGGHDLEALATAADIALLNPPDVSARVVVQGVSVADVRQAIEKIEGDRVKIAHKRVSELRKRHEAVTLRWALATDRQEAILRAEAARLETELSEWEGRTVPLTEQIDQYDRDIAERVARIAEVQKQWPEMQLRQKGEALRSIFSAIRISWKGTKKEKVTRYSVDQIRWEFASGEPSQLDQGYSRLIQLRKLFLLVFRGVTA